MLELRIMNAGQTMPLYDLPALLGRRGAARELGDTIEGLINFLDDLGGDPDLEDGGDDEFSGDEFGDPSVTEWHTRGRFKAWAEVPLLAGAQLAHEDDEIEDPAEDDDPDSCSAADDDPVRIISDGLPGDALDTEPNGDEGDYSPGFAE